MYDFETEYWNESSFASSAFDAFKQRSGNTHYVVDDYQIDTLGSDVWVLNMPEHSDIHYGDEGVTPATKPEKYLLRIMLYNDTLRTDAPQAVAGGTYGQYSCVIPTYEEWSAMTTDEKNAFKATYFEVPTGSTTKLGVRIDDYYTVYAWIGAIVRGKSSETDGYAEWSGGAYATDEDYPYYVFWRALTSTNARLTLNYNYSTSAITYHDIVLDNPYLFVPEDADVFKAIIIQAQEHKYTNYWTGYNSSGNMTYQSAPNGAEWKPSSAAKYKIRTCDWKIDSTTNNGYPYRMEMTDFSFDLVTDPIPSFFWRMNDNVNQGYPYLVEKDLPVLGAFGDNKNLRTVVVPRSVSYIGDYGFANTKLNAVTISSNCDYNENTSFPRRCVINYYND